MLKGILIVEGLLGNLGSVSRTSTGLCYSSCQIKKGHCHPCDWATCYDDVGFIRSLLTRLGEQYCVDLDRVYAYGCSNGGLMVP